VKQIVESQFMRIINAALVVVLIAGQANAGNNFYVSTTGSDTGGNGSRSRPYQTIQKAANVAQAGDNVFVRSGTYRETVTLSHGGSAGSPISFQPYDNEQVTVTGLDQLNSGWVQQSGSVYRHDSVSAASQVFLGGKPMVEARSSITSSGISYNNPLCRTYSTMSSGTRDPWTITSSAITQADHAWDGAKVAFLWSPGYGTSCGSVTSQVGNQISFDPIRDVPSYASLNSGNRFYLYDSLAAVDSPREWYYDSSVSQKKLYLQAPNGLSPNGQNVEIRTRLNGFDLNNKSFINVSGFKLQAATISVGGNNNLIDNCQILYPSPFEHTPRWADNYHSVVISGQYNTVQNSEIAYAWGSGVSLTNSNNVVQNNVIHDCNSNAAYTGCIDISEASGNSTVRNNTVYNDGHYGILLGVNTGAPNNQVLHNDVSRFGRLTQDLGGITTGLSNGAGTVIAYNKVHDCRDATPYSAGIYVDDNTSGFTIHHNLVTNCPIGAHVKGDSQYIYNNTLWNVDKAVSCDWTYDNIHTVNNLSNSGSFGGTDVHHNLGTSDQFVDSAVGDYRLASGSSARNAGAVISGITYPGDSSPDLGAIDYDHPPADSENPLTAGASFRTWTAGNQRAATLTSGMCVKSDGLRWNDASVGMRVGRYGSNDSTNRRAFMKFDLPGISGPISKAVLRLYENATPDNATGSDVKLYKVTSAWTDTTVSYSQSVDTSDGISGWYDPANRDLYTDIDITQWVQSWLNNPTSNYGLSLRSTIENVAGSATFWDGAYGVTSPQLIITVPEPSAIMLLSLGLMGILAHVWRKRKQLRTIDGHVQFARRYRHSSVFDSGLSSLPMLCRNRVH
jgi:hypothetical protein